MVSRRTMLTTGAGIAAGLTGTALVAGCNATGSKARWAGAGTPENSPSPSPTSTVRVNMVPSADAKDILPGEKVVINAEGGTLQSVSVVAGAKTVAGDLDADQRSWRSKDNLEYGQTYTITVSAVDASGRPTQQTSTFSTITPVSTAAVTFQASPLVSLKNGGTYGVGQPLIVHFSKAVKDRAAAEKAMKVTTEPAVEGRWRWINSQNAHYRPSKYWAPGTKISCSVEVFGVDLGGGVFGTGNASARFTIGPSRIAVADYNTKHMLVYVNGEMVRDIPVSLGKGGIQKNSKGETINFWTTGGPHVILTKEPSVRMQSASFGITDPKDPNFYDETIKLCCRISFSGEFVHFADWNISAHGRSNTSHGCINVGPANAQWFYDNFQLGDVVEVKNSPRPLAIDNGLGDWTVAWEKW